MKPIIAAVTLVIGMNIGMIPRAAAQEDSIKVTVPFDFAVGKQALSHGTYRIGSDGGFLTFRAHDLKPSLRALGNPGDVSADGRSRLVFDNIDGKYFLRQIVTNSTKTSKFFPQSDLEKRTYERLGTFNVSSVSSRR